MHSADDWSETLDDSLTNDYASRQLSLAERMRSDMRKRCVIALD